jgi:hypothetical protein
MVAGHRRQIRPLHIISTGSSSTPPYMCRTNHVCTARRFGKGMEQRQRYAGHVSLGRDVVVNKMMCLKDVDVPAAMRNRFQVLAPNLDMCSQLISNSPHITETPGPRDMFLARFSNGPTEIVGERRYIKQRSRGRLSIHNILLN